MRWAPGWLLVLLWLPAGADEVGIRFHTDPPDAEVYFLPASGDPVHLGRADEPILFDCAKINRSLRLRFRKEGYLDLDYTGDAPNNVINCNPGVWDFPEGGEIALKPDRHGLTAALILSCVSLAGVAGWLRSRSRQGEQAMEAWIQEKVVASDGSDPLLGRLLGDYWLLERLGRGGMATVYRGLHRQSQQEFAIKLLHEEIQLDHETRRRFAREVQIGGSLVHPNVVSVHDHGALDDGRQYLVMDLVRGRDLREQVRPEGLPASQALELLAPVFEGVAFAHSRGIVHRDLKPENALLREDGRVLVSDFGLARSHDFSTVTALGSVLGTPAYMAPEQIQEAAPSASSDQYALGVMTYEFLTGRPPFMAETAIALVMMHIGDEPEPPSGLRPELSPAVDAVVLKMLAKAPDERYPDVKTALAALRQAIEE